MPRKSTPKAAEPVTPPVASVPTTASAPNSPPVAAVAPQPPLAPQPTPMPPTPMPAMQPGAQPAMHIAMGVPQMPYASPNPAAMGQFAPYPQQPLPQFQNQMLQMMQMMMGAHMGGMPGVDPVSQPFTQAPVDADKDAGLDADIIRPSQLRSVVKTQLPLSVNPLLDVLCLTEDGKNSLGGIPKGCTIAFIGPPGKGKTRTAIAALCKEAYRGTRCGFVVAEEGFSDDQNSGRDDLSSRMTKIGMKSLGLSEASFQKSVAKNIAVLLSQYHKGHTWDTFVSRYRFMIEKEGIKFVIIDSLNTLDPSKTKTADNLAALKTYNHEKGVTCLTIGQIKDTGMPVGGESLIHTADVVFMLEEMGLASKEMAEFWGGSYRDRIMVINAVKSVCTPIFPHPIRVDYHKETGTLQVHPAQPKVYLPLPPVTVA